MLKLPVPNSSGLPTVNSAIFVPLDKPQSDEPPGWYYATVKEYYATVKVYYADAEASIEYANIVTEKLNLHSVKWEFTRKGQPSFIPSSKNPPKFPLKKIREEGKSPKLRLSSCYTSKAFTDDLFVFARRNTNVS